MNELTTLTYDLCRGYVRDNAAVLGPEYTELLIGKIRARDYKWLSTAGKAFPPDALQQVATLRVITQVEAFFKKNATFAEPDACKAKALATFNDGERQCRITNRRLDYYYTQRERLAPDLRSYMSKAEAFIDRVLGPFEPFLEALPLRIRFTSGATATRSRKESPPPAKISKRVVCTPSAEPYLQAISNYYGYGRVKGRLIGHNRVEFVPKNWETDRTIACEPDGNVPLQLAYDGYLKDRLLSIGVNLSSQLRNQLLAKDGSLTGLWATVDLKNASGTVAYNAVAWLFPQPWFRFLCDVRSPLWKDPGSGDYHPYAMFSSMGNGTTFTVETLMFAAACHAVGAKHYTVYGDDIIIDYRKVPALMRFMKFLGFTVNPAKSYWTGPFRESCGTNWLRGVDITPFYLRNWSRLRTELCHNINGLATIATPGGYLWKLLLSYVKEWKLPLVPFDGSSTSGVWVDVHYAYAKGLIRQRKWKLRYKAYVPKMGHKTIADSRSLFLWHHDKCRVTVRPLDIRWQSRSRVPTFSHKYVRKWVGWFPPATATPVHLYWWTDDLGRYIK